MCARYSVLMVGISISTAAGSPPVATGLATTRKYADRGLQAVSPHLGVESPLNRGVATENAKDKVLQVLTLRESCARRHKRKLVVLTTRGLRGPLRDHLEAGR